MRLAYERREAARAAQRLKPSKEDDRRVGRAMTDAWAREQGYRDFDETYRSGRRYTEGVTWMIPQAKPKRMPLEPGEVRMSTAKKECIRREGHIESKSFAEAAE